MALQYGLIYWASPGEQPDYVVAAWVLPYVYALRGDRDWRRSPQLTGSRQVSPLAVQAYKRLEAGDATIAELARRWAAKFPKQPCCARSPSCGSNFASFPLLSAPGQPAQWQLLRHRFQKAIAEGASTSQVTAISVLASIYLQAVIAASMEEVEMFLSPLTARSKIREVLRGLVATRQVHTLNLGHAPHFYVAGTLPEFAPTPTMYASSAMSAGGYFSRFMDHEDAAPEPVVAPQEVHRAPAAPPPAEEAALAGTSNGHQTGATSKPGSSRAHFSRPAPHARNRKPAQPSGSSRPARRPADPRSATRSANAARPANGRWNGGASKPANGNEAHAGTSNGNGHSSNGSRNGKPAPAWNRNGNAPAGQVWRSGTYRNPRPQCRTAQGLTSRRPVGARQPHACAHRKR